MKFVGTTTFKSKCYFCMKICIKTMHTKDDFLIFLLGKKAKLIGFSYVQQWDLT